MGFLSIAMVKIAFTLKKITGRYTDITLCLNKTSTERKKNSCIQFKLQASKAATT